MNVDKLIEKTKEKVELLIRNEADYWGVDKLPYNDVHLEPTVNKYYDAEGELLPEVKEALENQEKQLQEEIQEHPVGELPESNQEPEETNQTPPLSEQEIKKKEEIKEKRLKALEKARKVKEANKEKSEPNPKKKEVEDNDNNKDDWE